MEIKIESHLPVPKLRPIEMPRLPLDGMGLEDNFFLPRQTAIAVRKRIRMRQKRGHHPGKRFIVRDEKNGCRVWRVE